MASSAQFFCQNSSHDSERSLTLIHIFLQIRQTYWCLCLIDIWHKSLQLMEGREKQRKKMYGQIQEDYEWLELWCQLYTYITSGLGLRKFQVLDFCCTECTPLFEWNCKCHCFVISVVFFQSINLLYKKFEVLTMEKIWIVVFWVIMSYSQNNISYIIGRYVYNPSS
jgi:hypothetical protein